MREDHLISIDYLPFGVFSHGMYYSSLWQEGFMYILVFLEFLCRGTSIVVKQRNNILPPHLMTPNANIDFLKLFHANKYYESIYSQDLVPWTTYTAIWLKISPNTNRKMLCGTSSYICQWKWCPTGRASPPLAVLGYKSERNFSLFSKTGTVC